MDIRTTAEPQRGGILILSGAFGTGHNSAADALIAQMAGCAAPPAVRVDILEQLLPRLSSRIYNAFRRVVEETPEAFNLGYRQTSGDTGPIRLLEHPAVRRKAQVVFDRLIERHRPRLVVSVLPFAGRLYDSYRRESGCGVPLCICITDAIAHAGWIAEGCERYLVATEEVRGELLRCGVGETRIAVTGIPVRPAFLAQHQRSREKGEPRRLLVMGGGWGLMNHGPKVYRALEALGGIETTVLTGSNETLLRQLQRNHPGLRAVGYTDRVPQHMAESDLLLSKAGGVTLFEAIHSHLPMLVEAPFLEQEHRNAQTVVQQGIGRVLEEGESPLSAIRDLLFEDEITPYRQRIELLRSELLRLSPAEELLSLLCLPANAAM